jgi:glutaminyl-peptide cyclotransferase
LKNYLSFWVFFCIGLSLLFSVACRNNSEKKEPVSENAKDDSPENISFKVVNVLPHDTTSYTEGFLVHNGLLFESTGHTNSFPATRSLFGPVDLKTGKIDAKVEIDKRKYFGEGIVFLRGRVYQLTDTTRIGFVYDANTYKKLSSFNYNGEGWGFTTNGTDLIMSNGSSNIYYRDPLTFKINKTLSVNDNNGPVQNINEMKLIKGYIYANQWQTDYILKIDTTNGKVVGRLDLTSLKTKSKISYQYAEETNGIAYDSANNKIYVTGKLWPQIYEIQFNH